MISVFQKKLMKRAGLVGAMVLGTIFSVMMGEKAVYATASTLTISVTDSVALNISSLGDTGNFAHSDTSTNNVSIITNNGTGYTLGIKAKTNNSNALINSDDTSKTIPSITTSISESTYASSSSYNNTWGLRPSKLNSAVNENYIQAPTSASTLTTLDKTTSANPSTANNYNLAIGARINSSTTPGSYSNVFVITVTANPIPYTITYNKNTTDTVTNMPANTSSQTYDETVNISDQVPARDGFNFKGWCTTQVADGGTCTGTTYNPDGGGTDLAWTLDQTISSNSLTIYAMWELGVLKMQSMTLADCTTTPVTVVDERDNKEYLVAKLADNKCWMLENLALDPTTLTQAQLYGSDSHHLTNASNTTLGYLKSGGGSSPYTAYAVDNATSTNYYDRPMVATSGTCNNAYCVNDPSSGNWKSTSVTQPTINGVTSIAQGKIGVYYNYCAASAGSYCYSSSSSTGNASEDLCPAGWRMPTGGSSGEFQALYNQYSGGSPSQVAAFQTALVTPLSGFFDSGTARVQGNIGYFWSSTRYSNSNMYRLYVGSSSVYPALSYYRYNGDSLRCVLSS